MTVRDLYDWAKEHDAEDAPINVECVDHDACKIWVGIDDKNLSIKDGWVMIDVVY